MHIIAIAWIYVTFLMALTEPNITSGVLTFGLYGLGPLALFAYIFGTPLRRARRDSASHAQKMADTPDREHAEPDQ